MVKGWLSKRLEGKPGSKPVTSRATEDRNIRPVPLEPRRELHVLQPSRSWAAPSIFFADFARPTPPPLPRFTIEILLGDFPVKIQPRA